MNTEPTGDEHDQAEFEHPDTRIATMGQRPLAVLPQMTPAQARVDSVSRTMDAAMNRASTLQLTPEEVAALKADFPDEAFKPGAAGKENLLYLEHPFLRDRMDTVIGMGQWSILRTRPLWAEEFRTTKGESATRIYADCALLVRGCMVSESIGEMVYYPNNASQNYGDAAEGAMTAAFRRCAKNFGVGLQAWKKDWCEGWWQRKRGVQGTRQTPPSRAPVPTSGVGSPKSSNETPDEAEAALRQAPEAPPAPVLSAKERVAAFLDLLKRSKSRFMSQAKPFHAAEAYFRALTAHGLLPNEFLADISPSDLFPSADVENTPEANHAALKADFDRHMAGIKAVQADNDQIPGAEIQEDAEEAPTQEQAQKPMPAGTESRRITIAKGGQQEGASKKGPWTRFWIADADDVYYSSFDKKLGPIMLGLRGCEVTVWFVADSKGNTLHALDETP